jgi:hypothetical protein
MASVSNSTGLGRGSEQAPSAGAEQVSQKGSGQAPRHSSGQVPRPSSGQTRPAAIRRVHRNLERSILVLTLLAGLPGGVVLVYLMWAEQYSFEVRWTVAAVVMAAWIGCAAAAYQMITRVLYLQANLLGA